jgi:segregation and condensation protein B
MEKRKIVEAALFVAGSLSETQLKELVGDGFKEVVGELMKKYEESAIEIVDLGGRYLMEVRPSYIGYVSHLASKEFDNPVVRTLSVIAYNQPVTQSSVVKKRGNKAYEHIKILEKRGFIKSKPYGHTRLLRTTELFDEYFSKSGGEQQQLFSRR